ncbi:LysR family transcriptional regulator [Spongiactinospora gelatinilytica]|uniref:LysR family transcriptional regulator n=1 Tax=Spongiactinospora gelatinilytica TaxID=2666298 RepID=A0A2W2EYW2_9ACTN|nr:LysR family transcriptional regulator [Spongiactinospora gelatinilytica]PZG29806.1 LysR family transcriptional regulator [Spongiactinospora gelatinilytica]
MELRQLAYFVMVAETGGFGRAAERLGIVQPAVSQQVARLERDLGIRLFDRTTRHVRLTEAGERLLGEARAALAAADRVRHVAAGLAEDAEATLRLGTGKAPADRLYPALEALAAAMPRLRVRLVKIGVPERLAGVRAGDLDAATVRLVDEAEGLELLPICSDPLLAALPADHPLAAEPVLRLPWLGDLPLRLAARKDDPAFHDFVRAACRAAGIDPPPGPRFVNLPDTLLGIASCPPSWTVFYANTEPPPARTVVYRPLDGVWVTTYLAVRPGPPSAQVRHLLDACAKVASLRGRAG